MEYSFDTMHAIEVIVATLFFVMIIGLPVYFICKMCDTAERAIKKLDSPKANSVIKGLVALGGGYWALKQAHTAKTEKERTFYMSLAEEAQELAHEANTALEGKQSEKFYDSPDWWKKGNDDDQEPPSNHRWKN